MGAPKEKPINVASVLQRSPFRYPGGKTWLVSRIRLWLRRRFPEPTELVEPFAAGGIVGLTAAFEGLAKHVTMVELDRESWAPSGARYSRRRRTYERY